MKITDLKEGMTVFYYYRNGWGLNPIVECKVIRENGRLRVKHVHKDDHIKFYVDEHLDLLEGYLFRTAEEVQAVIDSNFEEWKKSYQEQSKQELADRVFRNMIGESGYDIRELKVMLDKFEKEFGVRPDYGGF